MKERQFERVAAAFAATLSEIGRTAGRGWETQDWSSGSVCWRLFRPPAPSSRQAGWKIHVSAAAVEAPEFCLDVLPLLFGLRAFFKIARRLEDIVRINSGDSGFTQLGKVITIYPQSDIQASEIALKVDRLWPASRGPEVTTDLHVRPGSAVSLRYGIFRPGPVIVSSSGNYEFALVMPDGTLAADTRHRDGKQALGVPPLPIACHPPRSAPVRIQNLLAIDGREYVPLTQLSDTPKAKIFLAFSSVLLNTVILKVGYPGVTGDHRGVDTRERMRKEHRILTALSSEPGLAPRPLEFVDEEWPLLIMEDFRGELLSELPLSERLESLYPLGRALARLHAAGFVHGDLKLENAVRRGDDVGLIDFEMAEREGDIISAGGTRGHLAPEVKRDERAAFARDIFALGGCVAHAVLGVPPGLLPDGTGRLRGLLSLEGATIAARLLEQFAAPNPGDRSGASAASDEIERQSQELCKISPTFGSPSTIRERNWCRRASAEAASLVRGYSHSDSDGRCWRNEHFLSSFNCEGINLGAAGIALGLVSVDEALGRNDFRDEIDLTARWLASRPASSGAAGLFTGDAGVSIALAVVGRRFAKDRYLRACRSRLESATSDDREIDLFSGAAGVLFASCLLSEILEEEWPLDLAKSSARTLSRYYRKDREIPSWSIDPATETPYLGCAHGSAGIAMALGSWGIRMGDQESIEIALETFSKLFAKGRAINTAALRMTLESERAHGVGNWCHGVAGYLWCILQAFGDHPSLREALDWSVQILRNTMTAATPTYCHGLAGRLEVWGMLAQIPRYRALALAQAGKTVRALRLLHHKRRGRIVWGSDDPTITTPDLWIGFLGPACALARHAAGYNTPLLSARWLAACAAPHRLQTQLAR